MTPLELRQLFGDESLVLRLTSSAPPLSQNVTEHTVKGRTVYEFWQEEEPADRLGQSMSGQMVSLVGGVSDDLASYSPRWPVRRALTDYERYCRRRHRLPSWTDHAAGPVCAMMLRMMVEHGVSLLWASQEVGVSYTRAERHVRAAAAYVSRWVEHWDHEQAGINLDPDCEVCTNRRPEVDLRSRVPIAATR